MDTKSAEDRYRILKQAIGLNLDQIHQRASNWQEPATEKQLSLLSSLINSGLSRPSRALRLAVLVELVGIPIQSSKELMKWEASVLISALKGSGWELSQDGQFLTQYAETILTQPAESAADEGTHLRDDRADLPGVS